MTLSAWTGTGITKVDRKISSIINYVAVIAKKAEVQTWSDVEAHLWKEYKESWNMTKYNAERIHHPGAGDKVKNGQV